MEEKLKQIVEITKKIKELEELKKTLVDSVIDEVDEKVDLWDATVSVGYTKTYKPKEWQEFNIDEVIASYKDAVKIDYRKLYEIANPNDKERLEKQEKKYIRISIKKQK